MKCSKIEDNIQSETDRIKSVYKGYQTDGIMQTRWAASHPGNQALLRERQRLFRRMLQDADLLPLAGKCILDVGCGEGRELAYLVQLGAEADHLYGIDLIPERIEAAQKKYPSIHFQQGSAHQLEFEDESMDLVMLFTVFSSILDEGLAGCIAREISRVLKTGGSVLWYDFRYNNPFNPHVRKMDKAMIRRLFPKFQLQLQSVTLLPPLARRLGRATNTLYPILSKVPLLRTHYLGFLVKPEEVFHLGP